jgi:hypothetical protein
LVHTFPHGKKSLIRLADTGESIEQGIRYVVNDSRRRFQAWRMGYVLVHVDVLLNVQRVERKVLVELTHSVDSKKARTSVLL